MKRDYLGHQIALTFEHKFLVTGPLVEHQTFDSYKAATDAIDRNKKVETKEGVPKLELDVISDDGEETLRIKGIHGGTSEITFVDKPKKENIHVYPVAPYVRDLLKERIRLRREIAKIDKVLDEMAIRTRRGYGRVKDIERLVELTNDVVKEHAEATKKAVAMETAQLSKRMNQK